MSDSPTQAGPGAPAIVGRLRRRIGLPVLVGWLATQAVSLGLVIWSVVLDVEIALLAPGLPLLNALMLGLAERSRGRHRAPRSIVLAVLVLGSVLYGWLLFVGGGLSAARIWGVEPTPRNKLIGSIMMASAVALVVAAIMTVVAVVRAGRST